MAVSTTVKTFDPKLLANIRPGTWVAISQDQERIAGTGKTMAEAVANAKKAGEHRPFVIRVPEKTSALIL